MKLCLTLSFSSTYNLQIQTSRAILTGKRKNCSIYAVSRSALTSSLAVVNHDGIYLPRQDSLPHILSISYNFNTMVEYLQDKVKSGYINE